MEFEPTGIRIAKNQGKWKIMLIKIRVRYGVTILDFNGEITGGDMALRKAMGEVLGTGAIKIVLNLGGVAGGDSSGLHDFVGEMIGAYTTATNRGARMKLANLPPVINDDILVVTQLITVFEVFDSEDEAVRSFT